MDRIKFEVTEDFDIYVSITNRDTEGGRTVKKPISVDTLYNILDQCKGVAVKKNESTKDLNNRDILYSSPIFPSFNGVHVLQHIIKNKEVEYFTLFREKRPARVAFYDDMFDNVGMPGLIFTFSLENKVIRDIRVFAVKDVLPQEDTKLYRYPLPNVDSYGCVCLGNDMSKYKIDKVMQLHSFPSMFFMMPATHELRGQNNSGMELRPFLESLRDNEFNDDYLVDASREYETYEKLITKTIG